MELDILKDIQNKEGSKSSKSIIIDYKDGLSIKYDKEELKKYYPHLMEEIESEKNIEENLNNNDKEPEMPNELKNPGVLDFIRRCGNNEEAFEILDYLLKRNEISENHYNNIKKRLQNIDGLKDLIEECGGFKKPGYYEKKYYKKTL